MEIELNDLGSWRAWQQSETTLAKNDISFQSEQDARKGPWYWSAGVQESRVHPFRFRYHPATSSSLPLLSVRFPMNSFVCSLFSFPFSPFSHPVYFCNGPSSKFIWQCNTDPHAHPTPMFPCLFHYRQYSTSIFIFPALLVLPTPPRYL